MRKPQTTLSLTPELQSRLQALAASTGESQSTLIRLALASWLPSQSKPDELPAR